MRKFFKRIALSALFVFCAGLTTNAYAVIGDEEIITVGTSTTLSTGSSTVLAKDQYNRAIVKRGEAYIDPGNFEAYLQYNNPVTPAVNMRYSFLGTPTVTSGFSLADGKAIILRSVSDMKNFKCCAGTTTTASYGTLTTVYSYSSVEGTAPKIITITGN